MVTDLRELKRLPQRGPETIRLSLREQTLSLHGDCGTRLEKTFSGLFPAPNPMSDNGD